MVHFLTSEFHLVVWHSLKQGTCEERLEVTTTLGLLEYVAKDSEEYFFALEHVKIPGEEDAAGAICNDSCCKKRLITPDKRYDVDVLYTVDNNILEGIEETELMLHKKKWNIGEERQSGSFWEVEEKTRDTWEPNAMENEHPENNSESTGEASLEMKTNGDETEVGPPLDHPDPRMPAQEEHPEAAEEESKEEGKEGDVMEEDDDLFVGTVTLSAQIARHDISYAQDIFSGGFWKVL